MEFTSISYSDSKLFYEIVWSEYSSRTEMDMRVENCLSFLIDVQSYRYFNHKKQTLVWETTRAAWARLAGLESGATCSQLHALATRAPSADRRLRM